MIMPKTALVSIAALALASSSADAFAPPAFLRTDAPGASSSSSSSALSMGKSQTTPGPSSAGSSGPATSEYRMKKMSKRMKGKKKKGGFSDKDFDDDKSSSKAAAAIMEHELAAEPEGGEGVQPLVAGTEEIGDFIIRIKDLGPVDESDEAYDLKEELGTPVHNFWLTALVNGKDVQKTRNIVLKDSAKHANFPGFRPGQIPPYAQPKMTFFALQETLVSSCQQSIKIFGVNEINKDQLGAVTFNENVEDLSKIYDTKKCPSIPFTANFRGSFDPDAVRQSAEEDATENEAEEESDE